MNSTQTTYLHLVRTALWGEKSSSLLPSFTSSSFPSLLRLCAEQGTGPLVFPLLLEQEEIPAALHRQMMGTCVQTMQSQVQLQHTLNVAWTALTNAGVRPVLMKGAGLAALYPEPQHRPWGDVDLFVGKEQYHPACEVMRNTFPDALKFDEELDHYKHYNLIADGISIEIHRVTIGLQHPLDERRFARMERRGMERAETIETGGITLRIPEPTFNALFVFFHSWEHMMTSGANIRQLCDLALLLHHYAGRLDQAYLLQSLKALKLLDVWQLYMYILVQYMGLPVEQALFYTTSVAGRADRLVTDLLEGRMRENMHIAGTPSAPRSRVLRKFSTMKQRMANAARVGQYSPDYARHLRWTTWLHGARRFFAKDRHWE